MTKTEMTQLLRSVGVDENTVTAMENAYDLGVEFGREACAKVCQATEGAEGKDLAKLIRARGEA